MDFGQLEALNCQPIGHRECQDVILKGGIGNNGPTQLGEGFGYLDFELEFFLKKALQAGKLKGVAKANDASDFGITVGVLEIG